MNKFFYNTQHSRVKPGFKLGMTFTDFCSSGISGYDDVLVGYNVGAFMDYETRRFFFQPGLYFVSKGAKDRDLDASIRLHYLEIPLSCNVKLFRHGLNCSDGVCLNIAPYGAVALAAAQRKGGEKNHLQLGNGVEEMDRWDYGVKVGLSMGLGSFEPFIGYDFGLNNLSNEDGSELYNRGFYFSAAIIFGK